MKVQILKSKIHRVKVTDANLDYIGSITIDERLMKIISLQKEGFSTKKLFCLSFSSLCHRLSASGNLDQGARRSHK